MDLNAGFDEYQKTVDANPEQVAVARERRDVFKKAFGGEADVVEVFGSGSLARSSWSQAPRTPVRLAMPMQPHHQRRASPRGLRPRRSIVRMLLKTAYATGRWEISGGGMNLSESPSRRPSARSRRARHRPAMRRAAGGGLGTTPTRRPACAGELPVQWGSHHRRLGRLPICGLMPASSAPGSWLLPPSAPTVRAAPGPPTRRLRRHPRYRQLKHRRPTPRLEPLHPTADPCPIVTSGPASDVKGPP
jgi:hypothetical protein